MSSLISLCPNPLESQWVFCDLKLLLMLHVYAKDFKRHQTLVQLMKGEL